MHCAVTISRRLNSSLGLGTTLEEADLQCQLIVYSDGAELGLSGCKAAGLELAKETFSPIRKPQFQDKAYSVYEYGRGPTVSARTGTDDKAAALCTKRYNQPNRRASADRALCNC